MIIDYFFRCFIGVLKRMFCLILRVVGFGVVVFVCAPLRGDSHQGSPFVRVQVLLRGCCMLLLSVSGLMSLRISGFDISDFYLTFLFRVLDFIAFRFLRNLCEWSMILDEVLFFERV